MRQRSFITDHPILVIGAGLSAFFLFSCFLCCGFGALLRDGTNAGAVAQLRADQAKEEQAEQEKALAKANAEIEAAKEKAAVKAKAAALAKQKQAEMQSENDPEKVYQKAETIYQKAEASLEKMMDNKGLSASEKRIIRVYIKDGTIPSLDAKTPSMRLDRPISGGDVGVPYYPVGSSGTSNEMTVNWIKNGSEMVVTGPKVVSDDYIWIEGMVTVGLKVGSRIKLNAVYHADETKIYYPRAGKTIPHLVVIDPENVRSALDGKDVNKWIIAEKEYTLAKAVAEKQRQQKAAAEAEMAREAAEMARKAADELNFDGLVCLKSTVKGVSNDFGMTITGVVINRRGRALNYAQITFNIYDKNGQVGTAIGNIAGLEEGGRWSFRAISLHSGTSYKLVGLTGR